MFTHLFSVGIAAVLALAAAMPAFAQPATGMGAVSGPLSSGPGEFGAIIFAIADSFVPLIDGVAILAMIISGFFLTITGNENQANTAKRVVVTSIAAIILVNVAPAIYDSYMNADASFIGAELLGLIEFVEVPLGIAAVVAIIISGIKAILAYGTEEGITQLRRTVIFVITGVVLIGFKVVLAESIVFGSPNPIINTVISVMNAITALILVIALAVIVYAGFLMIANIGNDEQYGRAKSLLGRVALGLIIVAVSAALVNLVVGSF